MSITLLVNSIVRTRGEVTDIPVIRTDLNTLATAITDGTSTSTIQYVSKSANYTATSSDNLIICDGTFTITLPTSVGIGGKVYNIKNKGTGIITVDANSTQTIDGELTVTLSQYENLTIVSDNSNWLIL